MTRRIGRKMIITGLPILVFLALIGSRDARAMDAYCCNNVAEIRIHIVNQTKARLDIQSLANIYNHQNRLSSKLPHGDPGDWWIAPQGAFTLHYAVSRYGECWGGFMKMTIVQKEGVREYPFEIWLHTRGAFSNYFKMNLMPSSGPWGPPPDSDQMTYMTTTQGYSVHLYQYDMNQTGVPYMSSDVVLVISYFGGLYKAAN